MTATLVFGGDVAPLRENPANMFGELTETIRRADLAVANLEFALSDRGNPVRGKIYPHKGPARALAALVEAGFDAVNLANNHMLDYGEKPLLDTLAGLAESGIAAFGAGRNAAEAARPVVLERGGLRIGLLGFTTTLPTGFAATDETPGVDPLRVVTAYRPLRNPEEYPGSETVVETRAVADDLARLVARVESLKTETDLVLVYAHWGASMTEAVHDFQREIGRAAIEAGAAAVFGGHQHVISAVEFHHGRPIVHGLGNLVFDFVAPFFNEATRRSIVLAADMTRAGLENCRLICCRTGVNGPVACLNPEVGDGADIAATLKRLSEPLGTEIHVGREEIRVRPRERG
jgi:poly-gamma-glutamate capsule biosynthesis protein CapA/YwtB (metallophosphatase superfamily)